MSSGGDTKHPDQSSLWESKIELGEQFFHEIIAHPIPLDLNTLKSLKRSPLGLDLYLWLTYRTFALKRQLRLTWPLIYRQFGANPARAGDTNTVNNFRTKCLRELKKSRTPGRTYTIGRSRARSSSRRRRRASRRHNCGSWNSGPCRAARLPSEGRSTSGWRVPAGRRTFAAPGAALRLVLSFPQKSVIMGGFHRTNRNTPDRTNGIFVAKMTGQTGTLRTSS